ncbi:MAG: hypothetical protein K0S33_3350 [Bacteroidetes bacterium]|jgi:hypothetical protein|nr:hypothetical protein [Bacteroidota bacterium]
MKRIFYLFFLSLPLFIFGQKTLKKYEGNLLFKETSYHTIISRELTDTTIKYFNFSIDSLIEIEEWSAFREAEVSFVYLEFCLVKRSDSLFIRYFNPLSKQKNLVYFLPLNTRDTIRNYRGYTLFVDSTSVKQEKEKAVYTKHIEWGSELFDFNGVYKTDTLITFRKFTLDCYKAELYQQTKHLDIRKILLIDKASLVPVYEEEHRYFRSMRPGLPLNKWILMRRMKLIEID